MNRSTRIGDLEKLNPLRIFEYCNYDGCPTYFSRDSLRAKDLKRREITYRCEQCESPIQVRIRYKREEDE